MRIQFLGHAGFLVDGTSSTVIMDPWLSNVGAYDSAWFQFPCNHHLDREVLERLQNPHKPCYLYVSHEHQDHFDRPFLQRIVQYQPTLVLADFCDKHFINSIRQLGFGHIRLFKDGEAMHLQDIIIKIFIDDGGLNRDSGILLREGNFSFLNLNDCRVFDRLHDIRRAEGHINVMACQFSGANWHPTCYAYQPEEYARIATQKSLSKFRSVLQAIKTVKPDWYFPSAGPPCFLDPDLLHLNFEKTNIFPSQFRIIEYLKRKTSSKVDAIMPGDIFDSEIDDFNQRSEQRIDPATEKDYIRQYAAKFRYLWHMQNRIRSNEEMDRILCRLADELGKKMENFSAVDPYGRNMYFSLVGLEHKFLCVDFADRKVCVVNKICSEFFYHIEAPTWQIERVLDRKMTWEDFCLTFRAKVARSPDKYDTLINGFIFSEADAIPELVAKIAAFRNQKARIVVEVGGRQYEIDRYCPHQGADLSHGWCEDGRYWVCSRHQWKYDLENGGRCMVSSDTIGALSLEAES